MNIAFERTLRATFDAPRLHFRFCKPPCSSISFSPCGNFLLYVTAVNTKPRSPLGEGDGDAVPSLSHQRQQEVGIIDIFSDEMRSTCVPLRGTTVSEEPPRVLKAFWAGDTQHQGEGDNKSAFSPLVVVTQKYIQLFKVSEAHLFVYLSASFQSNACATNAYSIV